MTDALFRRLETGLEKLGTGRGGAAPPEDNFGESVEQQVEAWGRLGLDEQNERNRERLDRLVIPWQKLVRSPNDPSSGRRRPLIFMHIPKSGGTTLEYLIAKNYTINGVIHINAPALERNPRALYKKGNFPKVVMGHHKLFHPLYQLVDHDFVHITMLREPVGRILSYYNYLQTSPNHGQHDKVTRMSMEEFLDSRDMVEVHNAQTMRLSGLLKRKVLRKGFSGEEAVSLAKETLERRFSLFGLTERYTEFLLMNRRLLGWADIFYRRRNVSKRQTKREAVDPTLIDLIRERNALDLELFEFATGLFNSRCAELGITAVEVERARAANDAYCDLLDGQL